MWKLAMPLHLPLLCFERVSHPALSESSAYPLHQPHPNLVPEPAVASAWEALSVTLWAPPFRPLFRLLGLELHPVFGPRAAGLAPPFWGSAGAVTAANLPPGLGEKWHPAAGCQDGAQLLLPLSFDPIAVLGLHEPGRLLELWNVGAVKCHHSSPNLRVRGILLRSQPINASSLTRV